MKDRLILLDSEAVAALYTPTHAKHRRVLAHVHVIATRRRKARTDQLAIPTAVRVESGWDRRAPAAAFINHLRITDVDLDRHAADQAAAIRAAHSVSVADAHLGAVVVAAAVTSNVTVLTSDPGDIATSAGTASVTIVAI